MKKIILITTMLFSASMADSVLLVKKGWQLIGSSTSLDNMSKFTTDNVEQVWHFDASSQQWQGYSPDATVQEKMSKEHIEKLKKLKNWHGFWIKSKKDWSLTFKDKELNAEPSQAKNSDVIELKKGWNLISLPVDTVVTADIFKGMTAWKYNQSSWELFDETQESNEFPKLGHIKNSDGIWVKAGEDRNISVMEEASKLHNFANIEEMKSYIKERANLYSLPVCGIEPFLLPNFRENVGDFEDAPVASNTLATNTSETNLQEQGVDESDILKHNGTNVFYLGKRNGSVEYINVTSFAALSQMKSSTILSRIALANRYVDSFYLVKDRLVVLSTARFNNEYSTPEQEDIAPQPHKAQNIVDIYDVKDIKNIKRVAEFKVDGSLKNSRVIGDKLYLISSFNPQFEISYPKEYFTPSPLCQAFVDGEIDYGQITDDEIKNYADCYSIYAEDGRYYRFDYDKPNVKINDLLPEIEGTTLATQALVTPERLYASAKQKESTTMTSISSFSIESVKYLKSTSFIGSTSVEYASSSALYLVSNEYPYYYDFSNYKSRSTLYKFNFDDDLSYKAVGSVYGTALNQFSLSEYNDILRIATTEGFSWGSAGTKNSLYTLKENNKLLKIEGILSGLGKEGESIKSVRFMGNKAYLVTFKTTDPLYTIDLSNPKKPKKMGELKVNGYSAYLHPIGEDKLLGIGQNTDKEGRREGVKIELFDISDFEHPASLDSITLRAESYSELEHNHKALAYRANDNLFAFPYETYGNSLNNYQSNHYLGIYQVANDALKSYEELQSSANNWGEHRGLIFDFNGTTYISFFDKNSVLTKKLTPKEK